MINIAFLSMALGILGFIMIYRNFNQTLSLHTYYSVEENNMLQASIEYHLLDSLNDPRADISQQLMLAGETTISQLSNNNTVLSIIYDSKTVFYNSEKEPTIPDKLFSSLELGSKSYTTIRQNGRYLMYVMSKAIINEKDLYILTISDVSNSYDLLYDQIRYFVLLVILVLIICGLFLYLVSSKLTKPLEQLNTVTDTIANGDYTIHPDISSNDEIGMLAGKFNKMTLSISNHIDELNQMVKQREQFVADFTHEIKTPMTAIIGYADTLRSRPLSHENQMLAYQYIYDEGRRLEAMSSKLFNLIYLNENELELSLLDTKTLCDSVIQSVSPLYDTKSLSLISDIEDAEIYGEVELLKTALINILDNARKASNEGGLVVLKGYTSDKKYCLSITDNGCGMDEETCKHICDEFYMADKSRSRSEGGAGLGMSLVAIIIKRHHATMDIKSTLGKGTTITLTLPGNT